MEDTTMEHEQVLVRRLRPDDLESVIALDARITGRRREEYFKLKLEQALAHSSIEVSLAAEHDDRFAGFLLCRVFYGEFGTMEQVAVLDTIGVHPDLRGAGVGKALLQQLKKNLHALTIPILQTEVDWDNQGLLSFFHHAGFRPAPRMCLDLAVDATD